MRAAVCANAQQGDMLLSWKPKIPNCQVNWACRDQGPHEVTAQGLTCSGVPMLAIRYSEIEAHYEEDPSGVCDAIKVLVRKACAVDAPGKVCRMTWYSAPKGRACKD